MKGYIKRIAAFALATRMLFSSVPYTVVSSVAADVTATEEAHIWDGTSDVSWYDDEDTEFHISTPEQLAGLSDLVNAGKTMEGKTFVLENDLQMNDVSTYDEWETTPPENQFNPLPEFSGSILGNNHSIIGLFFSESGFIDKATNPPKLIV